MTELFLFLLIVAVLGLVGYVRGLARRVERLQDEVARLRRRSRESSKAALLAVTPAEAAGVELEEEAPAVRPVVPVEPRGTAPARAAATQSALTQSAVTQGAETQGAETQDPETERPKTETPDTTLDWERWIGIRGAAVVGGIALILAGLFFVQVAIERGWLGPAARDALALVVGALALSTHLPLRRRGLVALADSLAGAGTVLMYGGAWAASRLHDLVPPTMALVVMAGTTGTALLLAMRSHSQLVAGFAVIGGFTTPLLLGTLDHKSTATLFGYALVLDLALIAMARARGWRMMVPAALGGTFALHFSWGEVNRHDPASTWLVSALLGGTVVLFTSTLLRTAGSRTPHALSRETREFLQLLTLGAPAALFARHAVFPIAARGSLWPAAAFCGVLACAAAAATRRFQSALYLGLTGVFSAVSLGWFYLLETGGFRTEPLDAYGEAFLRWSAATMMLAVLLAACAHWTRLRRARGGLFGLALVSIFTGTYGAIHTFEAPFDGAYFAVLAALILVGCHGASYRRGATIPGALIGAAAGLCVLIYRVNSGRVPLAEMGHAARFGAPMATFALALGAIALDRFGASKRKLKRTLPGALSAASAMIGLGAFPIARMGLLPGRTLEGLHDALTLGALGAATLAFTLAAPVHQTRSKASAAIRHLALLAGLALTAPFLFREFSRVGSRIGSEAPWNDAGLVAVLIGALPIAAVVRLRTHPKTGSNARSGTATTTTRVIAVVAAASLLVLLTRAVPLARWISAAPSASEEVAAGKHVVLLGSAAFALVLGAVVDRRDRLTAAGILTVAATLAASSLARAASSHSIVCTAALALASAALLGRRARAGKLARVAGLLTMIPVASLLAQTFLFRAFLATESLLPAQMTIDFGLTLAGALGAAHAIHGVSHADPDSDPEFSRVLRFASVGAILTLMFGWMNAVVLNRYTEPGTPLHLTAERLQERDLALSSSWGLFAGALLITGMIRRSAGLRWTSLLVFVACILKVFLHDLGALTGLSRVASFLGLALALLAVSLLYARVLGTGDRGGGTLRGHDPHRPPGGA